MKMPSHTQQYYVFLWQCSAIAVNLQSVNPKQEREGICRIARPQVCPNKELLCFPPPGLQSLEASSGEQEHARKHVSCTNEELNNLMTLNELQRTFASSFHYRILKTAIVKGFLLTLLTNFTFKKARRPRPKQVALLINKVYFQCISFASSEFSRADC